MRETILSLYALYFIFICAYACNNTVIAPKNFEIFGIDIIVNANLEFKANENAMVSETRNLLNKEYRSKLYISRSKINASTIFEPVYSYLHLDNQ